MNEISVIDFGPYLNGSKEEQLKVAYELVECFRGTGFVYLNNFGISEATVQKAFEAEKQFFQLSLAVKETARSKKAIWCGYYGMAEETLNNKQTAGDLREGFLFTNNALDGWPEAEFKAETKNVLLDFYEQCYGLAYNIIRALAMGLEIDQKKFDSILTNTGSSMRLNHYPALVKPIDTKQVRCGEHCDYGAVSLLFQDSAGGLEIKTRNDEWIKAPALPQTLILNLGDCMERWTNGYLRSAPHRVANPTDLEEERHSIVFFCDPVWDVRLDAFSDFQKIDYKPKFTATTYREHVFGKYDETRS